MNSTHSRELSSTESDKLRRIVRQGNGSVTTWQRAQILLFAADGLDTSQIAPLAYSTEASVRSVLQTYRTEGLDALYH